MLNSSKWKIINNGLNYLLIALVAGYVALYFYKKPKFSEGDLAPDFTAVTMMGKQLQLRDLMGEYILLDFWGSWCGPCRRENQEIVAFYNQNFFSATEQKLRIVSIAIETDSIAWQRAITADKLDWPDHIVQLDRFSSPIAKLYGVREIPTKYLIGRKGEIIKVNPEVSELKALIQ